MRTHVVGGCHRAAFLPGKGAASSSGPVWVGFCRAKLCACDAHALLPAGCCRWTARPCAAALLRTVRFPIVVCCRAPLTWPSSTQCLATCWISTTHWSAPASCSSPAGELAGWLKPPVPAACAVVLSCLVGPVEAQQAVAALAFLCGWLVAAFNRWHAPAEQLPLAYPHRSHLVISHPLGRPWHEGFRAQQPQLVPNELPQVSVEDWLNWLGKSAGGGAVSALASDLPCVVPRWLTANACCNASPNCRRRRWKH